jgi:hypothetical protein
MKEDLQIIRREIEIRARRTATKQELLRVMSCMPNAKLLSDGTRSIFQIDLGVHGSSVHMSFGKDIITMEFRSRYDSLPSLNKVVMIALSILTYLEGVYEARLESLYPLVISALRDLEKVKETHEHQSPLQLEFMKELRNSNITLSRIAIKEADKNRQKDEIISKYAKILEFVDKFYWVDEYSINKFCESTGIDSSLVGWAKDNRSVQNNDHN